ncbi:epimerase [Raphidocelis subcapitata]|uniref:Epimerase n=1 Tax=Raphidocelis subcapitata TaxID=307507 RepID=A0A2V0PEK7_9CHLO|nr:epimerase [Raphidocelis subcapitata]|eukprot:GBF97949.1 epimerase [Raphidocelis subcapitata]
MHSAAPLAPSHRSLHGGCSRRPAPPPSRRLLVTRASAAADAPAAGGAADPRFAALGKVLVAGAAGGTGRCVVQALRAKGVPVRAMVRDAAAAAAKLPPAGEGLEIVEGDVVNFVSLPPALAGCDAIVVATGARDPSDPLGPLNVELNGNLNLIEAAKRAGCKRFVLVSSIGADELLNPLNVFWGVLLFKKQAELALARAGFDSFTVVRPGGLKSGGGSGGALVMAGAGTFGFPPFKKSGSIQRSRVADVCAEALVSPSAWNKVVEIIEEGAAPSRTLDELFASV